MPGYGQNRRTIVGIWEDYGLPSRCWRSSQRTSRVEPYHLHIVYWWYCSAGYYYFSTLIIAPLSLENVKFYCCVHKNGIKKLKAVKIKVNETVTLVTTCGVPLECSENKTKYRQLICCCCVVWQNDSFKRADIKCQYAKWNRKTNLAVRWKEFSTAFPTATH